MSGKYSCYYNNNFTQNAKKIFEKYVEDCITAGKQYQLSPTAISNFIDQKAQELTTDHEKIDAETIMDILSKLPSIKKIVSECSQNPEFKENTNLYAQLHLSDNNRFLGGVCGGLGEYFRIDPTLVRVAFVAGAFVGGAAIIIYIVLWLAFFEKEKDKNYPPLVALIFQLLNIARLAVISMLWLISKKDTTLK